MKRRQWILFLVLFAGCTKTERNLQTYFPNQIVGWTLEQTRAVGREELPPEFATPGFKQAITASYRGQDGRITSRILEYKTDSEAFEKMQRWHQERSTSFNKGPLFVTVQSTEGTPVRMTEFARSLQDQIKP